MQGSLAAAAPAVIGYSTLSCVVGPVGGKDRIAGRTWRLATRSAAMGARAPEADGSRDRAENTTARGTALAMRSASWTGPPAVGVPSINRVPLCESTRREITRFARTPRVYEDLRGGGGQPTAGWAPDPIPGSAAVAGARCGSRGRHRRQARRRR